MTRALAAPLLLLLALGGCRCGDGTLGGVEVGFTVEGRPVDFGRALEGGQVTRTVRLVSTGRGSLSVEVSAQGPFSAAGELELPGGGDFLLPVTFTAGVGPARGGLTLSARGKSVTLELLGEGVVPLDCQPTAECRQSRFVLETNSCAESPSPDLTACRPSSACLENGLCQAGRCVGAPRSCDDRNKCTSDACAEGTGCVHTAVACPPPSNPCRVPACDPERGCTDAPAADGTPCGEIDCVSSHLCIAGECRTVPTPEGFVCLPPTPCQAEGRCRSQKCERPDAGELSPKVTVPLLAAPVAQAQEPSLLSHQGNLFWESCAPQGADAGCSLTSYTGTGFLRFRTPHADRSKRVLLSVSDAGVLVLHPDRLEAFAQGSGAPLWSFPLAAVPAPSDAGLVATLLPSAVAVGPAGEAYLAVAWAAPGAGADGGGGDGGADGGLSPTSLKTLVRLSPDGGLSSAQALADVPGAPHLALDAKGRLSLYAPGGGLLSIAPAEDGGLALRSLPAAPGGPSLAVHGSWAASGGVELWDVDAGAAVARFDWREDGGEVVRTLAQPPLLAHGRGYVGYRVCPAPGCAPDEELTRFRAVELADAGTAWEVMVLPPFLPGRVEEAALVSGGALATVTEVAFDAGPQAHLQLFGAGKRLFVCPFPSGAELRGVVFDRGFVYALVRRGSDWSLEAYDLMGLPMEGSGWPQRHGVSGARRER